MKDGIMLKGSAVTVIACSLVAGCTTGPVIESGVPWIERDPVVILPGTRNSEKAAREATAKAAAEGSPDLLRRYLSIMANLNHAFFAGNRVDLFTDGPPTFESMFQDMEEASTSILVESYIFEDSALGERMASMLIEKAQEGVTVHIIYDSVGSLTTSDDYFATLQDNGVNVCAFNPVNPLEMRRLENPNTRDHRKIIVVDDRVTHTGGINVSHVYASTALPGFGRDESGLGWRDTQIRVEGPAAGRFGALVRKTLETQECNRPVQQPYPVESMPGDKLISIVVAQGDSDTNQIYEVLYTAIEGAQSSVDLTMAYFSPDERFIEALERAGQRGVLVRLLLAGETDWPILLYAGQAHFSELLQAGVKIFQYSDGTLHAKTAVIDGVWSTVGYLNLDWRSLVFNDVINAVVMGSEFAGRMTAVFERDIEATHRVLPEEWRQRGLYQRMREFTASIMRRWL